MDKCPRHSGEIHVRQEDWDRVWRDRAALLEAMERIEDRLHKLVNGGGAEGKPTMGELKQGLRAARDEARLALEAAK